MLRWPADRCTCWACWNWRSNNLATTCKALCSVCRHGCHSLTSQLLLKISQHVSRECVSFLPDLDQTGQLVLLLGGHVLHRVIEKCGHEFGHTLDCRRVAAWIAAAIDMQTLSALLRLLDPFTHDAIDDVDGTKLVGSMSLLERAVERLYDFGFCL